MDVTNRDKEVYFNIYCSQCEYEEVEEKDEPCYDCLVETVNTNSHKPVYFKEKES